MAPLNASPTKFWTAMSEGGNTVSFLVYINEQRQKTGKQEEYVLKTVAAVKVFFCLGRLLTE